jgi:hypothetical protein
MAAFFMATKTRRGFGATQPKTPISFLADYLTTESVSTISYACPAPTLKVSWTRTLGAVKSGAKVDLGRFSLTLSCSSDF